MAFNTDIKSNRSEYFELSVLGYVIYPPKYSFSATCIACYGPRPVIKLDYVCVLFLQMLNHTILSGGNFEEINSIQGNRLSFLSLFIIDFDNRSHTDSLQICFHLKRFAFIERALFRPFKTNELIWL